MSGSNRPQDVSVTEIVARSFRVADLVNDPLLVVPSSTSNEQARNVMKARSFDVIGVRTTAKGAADKWVRLQDLDDGTSPFRAAKPLLARDAVERSMPLVALLDLLIERDHVFVLDGDTVRHIVTRADVGKPPVSVLVLTFLLALESDLIRLAIPRLGSNWFSELGERQDAAMKVYTRRSRNNTELGLEACLYFDDAVLLARKAPGLVSDLGMSPKRFNTLGESMAALRNDLAHGGTILDRVDDAVVALKTFKDVRELARNAARVIASEPSLVELFSDTMIEDENGRIYAGGDPVVPLHENEVYYVLTAYNPGGRTQPAARNAEAQRLLETDLEREGLAVTRVTGRSTNGRWAEPSALVASERQVALDIGSRYGQDAVFELDSQNMRVVDCKSGAVSFEGPRHVRVEHHTTR